MNIIKRPTIGVIDYDVGNLLSLTFCFKKLGFKSFIGDKPSHFDKADILLLPGVGAFSNAMKSLRKKGLDSYIVSSFYLNKPIIGICLGMQLLSEGSSEFGFNNGLGLIPGTFEALNNGTFNIGWNAIDVIRPSSLISNAHGKAMYFNHSYHYCGPREYVEAECHLENISLPVAAAIHRGNLWGLQFHPEKSQSSGLEVFKKLVHNLAKSHVV